MQIRPLVSSVALLLLFALAGTAQAASFHGKWKSNLGTLFIYQTGQHVEGTYAGKNGKLSGTVSGNRLTGHYSWVGKQGRYELVLNQDGTGFTGKWKRDSLGGSWSGKKIAELPGGPTPTTAGPVPQPPRASNDFSGNWQVEDAANGKNRDYHPMPWTFANDGTVHAGQIWRGLWERLSPQRIRVILIDTQAHTDQFDMTFSADGREFTAIKNGRPYRYGRKR